MKRPISLSILTAATLGAGMLACGGEDLVLPSEGEPASITLLQGNGQSGRVGEELPQPLIFQVVDATGRPVIRATVVIELDGGAEALPDTVSTGDDGRASVDVMLGPTVGPASGLARVLTQEDQRSVETEFNVIALAASANGIALESGANQTAPAGQPLPEALVVRVTDAFGNAIAGVPITWSPVGGGSVSQASTTTDNQGRSSVLRVLGSTAGQQSTLAISEGLAGSPVAFLHTATAGNPAGVSIVSGNEQFGAPGATLPQPLVVQVADNDGNAVTGAAVTWIVTGGGGSLNPETSTTDQNGRASTVWTLGASPGSNTATAVVSGVGQASFHATATTGAPAQLRIISGNGQTGQVGQRLAAAPVVAVLDAAGNPIAGATVTWTVRAGGGRAEPVTSTTDAGGQTSTQWTLGPAPEQNVLEASVSGVAPVSFQATATAGAPSALALRTQPSSSAEAGVAFDRQPVVQLRDASGNDVSQAGVAVTAAIASGTGTLGGTTTRTTDGDGRATFTDLRINGATGPHELIFAAAGFTSITSTAIVVEPAATSIEITSDAPDPSPANGPVVVAFVATSRAGVPVGTVLVSASETETCSAEASAGTCTLVLTGPGARTITAAFGGSPLFQASSDTEAHQVVGLPTARDDAYTTDEGSDKTLVVDPPGVLSNDDGGGTAELISGVSNGTLALNGNGGFSYTPEPSFFGEDQFTYRVINDAGSSGPATVRITVRPINDSPRFTPGPDQNVSVAAGPQTVTGWATDITPGAPNESDQTVEFFVQVTSGADLFASAPTISPDGTLRYTPAAAGTATVSVLLRDSGGTGNGGRDTSDPVTVTFTFTP
jgi:hypothetical protein